MPTADNVSRPAPARSSVLALVVLVILLCSPCLGLGGGLAYVNAAAQGRFARWRTLGAPPTGAVALITADPNLVYVETASGGFFACAHNGRAAGAGCWAPAEPPFAIAPEADFERAVFSGDVPPPPGNLVDQLPVSLIFADTASEARYAVLDDGSVWVWEYSAGGYDSLIALLLGPVVGLGAGLLIIGVLVLLGRGRRGPAAA
jgi:hypothetical protein